MRKLATAVALASLSLTAACGGDTASEVESAGDSATDAASDAASGAAGEASEAAGSATDSASPDASATAGGGGGGGQTLIATVGSESDPNAFVINLADESGQRVTSLPAGDYTLEVTDYSGIHNFHLAGAGGVDESTTVPGTGTTTWEVSLKEGDYTYVCDPHPRMSGSFTVGAA